VKVTPPAGITVDNSNLNTLVVNSSTPVSDVKFTATAANKAVDPRYLGTGTGITIRQGSVALVPLSFTAVRSLLGTQKRMNATTPSSGGTAMTITNLNTANLGLSGTDRTFKITLTTA